MSANLWLVDVVRHQRSPGTGRRATGAGMRLGAPRRDDLDQRRRHRNLDCDRQLL